MRVEKIVPILNVSDVEVSLEWFAKLGWKTQFTWNAEDDETAPTFAATGCDDSEIFSVPRRARWTRARSKR